MKILKLSTIYVYNIIHNLFQYHKAGHHQPLCTLGIQKLRCIHFFCLYSGYEVQFIVVDKIPLNDNGVPIVSTGAHGNISLSEQEVAAKAKAATSFYYRYKQQDKLPHFITIKEDLLGNALRNESSYIVVTVAYTNKVAIVLLIITDAYCNQTQSR